MGFKLFAIVAVLLAVATVTIGQQQCGENEEYNTCGSACPQICGNKAPVACTDNCVIGCFCKTGYIRTKSGKCVANAECKE